MATSMTQAVHATRGTKSMTQCLADEKQGSESLTETAHRLADEIDNPVVVPPVAPDAPDDDTNDGTDVKTIVDDTWTIAELKNYATEQSIDVNGLTKKSDLIAAING